MLDFFVAYMNFENLGKIDNSHLAKSDYSDNLALDPECVKLAVLFLFNFLRNIIQRLLILPKLDIAPKLKANTLQNNSQILWKEKIKKLIINPRLSSEFYIDK